ncbi:hypothetical protein J14TS2_39560 [Bacillus sp. J14TS2]|uniref:hypothetical protein n=1 Tax=Bacillus sp. J14TS2 TaxID=2807188 RepID=UPI001B08BADF|nr:hypothetical protein [Bacillus sp. J14TS2]GIN73481.1 hypothetical protein J14TS2_39560 [Bacillus sp. J14TS2]
MLPNFYGSRLETFAKTKHSQYNKSCVYKDRELRGVHSLRKKNITLFMLILIAAIVWGILYWVFIAPNVRITK